MKIKPVVRKFWSEWVRPLALPLLLVAGAKSALADINYVPSGSMKPTILEGDVVFVNKLAYDLKVPFTTHHLAEWSNPSHGDIVVCFAPDDGTRLVKRVVGIPGDTIELRHNSLLLNGKPVIYSALDVTAPGVRDIDPRERNLARFAQEDLSSRRHSVMALPGIVARRDFGPISLAPDQYFMMGDNRDNSRDSRYFGVVNRSQIVGEAKGVFVSGDLAHWLQPRLDRFFSKLN